MKAIVLLEVVLAVAAGAADYSARQTTRDGVDLVVLTDSPRHTEVTILPGIGNMAYQMTVNGKDVLKTPPALAEFKAKPGMTGTGQCSPGCQRSGRVLDSGEDGEGFRDLRAEIRRGGGGGRGSG